MFVAAVISLNPQQLQWIPMALRIFEANTDIDISDNDILNDINFL